MAVKPIPEAYRTITPYIEIENAAEAIEFYKRAFGTKGRVRMEAPGGKVGHAELEIGDSVLMLADPFPESSIKTQSVFVGIGLDANRSGEACRR